MMDSITLSKPTSEFVLSTGTPKPPKTPKTPKIWALQLKDISKFPWWIQALFVICLCSLTFLLDYCLSLRHNLDLIQQLRQQQLLWRAQLSQQSLPTIVKKSQSSQPSWMQKLPQSIPTAPHWQQLMNYLLTQSQHLSIRLLMLQQVIRRPLTHAITSMPTVETENSSAKSRDNSYIQVSIAGDYFPLVMMVQNFQSLPFLVDLQQLRLTMKQKKLILHLRVAVYDHENLSSYQS